MAGVALADMLGQIWEQTGREIVGAMIIIAQVLVSAAGIVTTATAFNALSDHSACTVIFALASTILITLCSSIRTFSRLGWLTWFGFAPSSYQSSSSQSPYRKQNDPPQLLKPATLTLAGNPSHIRILSWA
jgi:hypothetical protein